jgi:hypothetical protein
MGMADSEVHRTLYESSRATAGIWQRMLCSAWGDIFHDINRFENNCIHGDERTCALL